MQACLLCADDYASLRRLTKAATRRVARGLPADLDTEEVARLKAAIRLCDHRAAEVEKSRELAAERHGVAHRRDCCEACDEATRAYQRQHYRENYVPRPLGRHGPRPGRRGSRDTRWVRPGN